MDSDDHAEKIIVEVDRDLEPLIPEFLEDTRRDARALLEALGRGDFEKMRGLAHSTKGAAGGYGFHALSEIGGRLEAAAKGRDAAAVPPLAREFVSHVERLQVVFK